jgi:hypothetical protein
MCVVTHHLSEGRWIRHNGLPSQPAAWGPTLYDGVTH